MNSNPTRNALQHINRYICISCRSKAFKSSWQSIRYLSNANTSIATSKSGGADPLAETDDAESERRNKDGLATQTIARNIENLEGRMKEKAKEIQGIKGDENHAVRRVKSQNENEEKRNPRIIKKGVELKPFDGDARGIERNAANISKITPLEQNSSKKRLTPFTKGSTKSNQVSSLNEVTQNSNTGVVKNPLFGQESTKPSLRMLGKFLKERNYSDTSPEKPTIRQISGQHISQERNGEVMTLESGQLHSSLGEALAKPRRNKAKKTKKDTGIDIMQVDTQDLSFKSIEIDQPPVPNLSYGLDRVLFNPGVYQLQDRRSRVYNFDPYLQTIMPVSEFDFDALKPYVTSSKDESLSRIALENGKRYVGSTSSMTGILAQFHFLLSQWREVNTSMLSRGFPDKLSSFTLLQRAPSAIFLKWQKHGTYAIDADKEFATASILSMLGKSMEKLLTLDTQGYERYRKPNSDQISETERNAPEAFHYSGLGDFLMRSQLDAYDPRLPGTGMFDLKTRAVVSVRHDTQNFDLGSGYEIKGRYGDYESYEREYFDLIRAAFLKYSLQVRMGRMDGIFVAFHNTERIFGFQYIPLSEMDLALHGQSDMTLGDKEFMLSVKLLNDILNKATKKYPEQSLRIHFETRDTATPFMYIFAEPVTEDMIDDLQSRNNEKVEEFERQVLGLKKMVTGEETGEDSSKWEEIHKEVQKAMDKDGKPSDELSEALTLSGEVIQSLKLASGTHQTAQSEFYPEESIEKGSQHLGTAVVNEQEDEELEVEEEEAEEEEEDAEDEEKEEQTYSGETDDEIDDIAEENAEKDRISKEESVDEAGELEHRTDERSDRSTVEMKEQVSDIGDESQDIGSGSPNEQSNDTTNTSSTETNNGDSNSAFENHADANFLDKIDEEHSHQPTDNLLAMILTIRNKVNGKYVLRPENITASHPSQAKPNAGNSSSEPSSGAINDSKADKWAVEYSLADIPDLARAWTLYSACQTRRRKRLDPDEGEGDGETVNHYVQRLRKISAKGRAWRREEDRKNGDEADVVVVGRD